MTDLPQIIYEAYTDSDPNSMTGCVKITLACFTREADAKAAISGQIGAGTRPIRLYGSFQEFKKEQNLELRRKAMAKLTKEEIEALGLKEE